MMHGHTYIILYMNLEGRPKNRWQAEVREDGRLSWWKSVEGKGM